jgi:hypothetical protein
MARLFYLQVRYRQHEDVSQIKSKLANCVRVLRSGPTTVSNPNAGWFEVAADAADVNELLEFLRPLEIVTQVEKAIPVDRGQARLLSKQIDLFR